jgi:Asp-tRNA(Asn)/Glu-tRNA(Gln) amidotransferase A subunit family amidase
MSVTAPPRVSTPEPPEPEAAHLQAGLQLSDALNPFAVRLDERARSAALAADADLARGSGGPLCGVPVTIKDSLYLAGVTARPGRARWRPSSRLRARRRSSGSKRPER